MRVAKGSHEGSFKGSYDEGSYFMCSFMGSC